MGKFGFGIATMGGSAITAILLAACGGGSGNDAFTGEGDDSADSDPGTSVGAIYITGDNELATGTDGELELRVVVVDGNNRVMSGVEVIPDVDDRGIVVGGDQQTDDGGRAVLTLTSEGSFSNRSIDFRVSAGDTTSSVFPIDVAGTRWVRQSQSLSGIGGEVELALEDGSDDRVSGSHVSYDYVDGLVSLTREPVQTDARGELSVEFEATGGAAGDYRFDVTGSGATYSQFWSVADQTLQVVSPAGETFWPVGESHPVQVKLTGPDGDPIPNQEIHFEATRGSLSAPSASTEYDGVAEVSLTSDNIGPTRIQARYETAEGPVVADAAALFVTRDVKTVSIQAQPSTISTEETSRIIASVRDDDEQPVQGVEVGFSVFDQSGGDLLDSSALTDQFGRAEVTYRAGSIASSDAGVQITATATRPDGSTTEDDVNLTVTAEALYISLGTGNTLRNVNDTTYGLPYTAVVTDSSGSPVANRELSLSLWSTDYRRGRWELIGDGWKQNVTNSDPSSCPTEDPDRTGLYDEANDVSDTETLLPGNVATLVPDGGAAQGEDATIRTDENGFANFEIRYAKEYAEWVRVELRGSIEVDGTEGTRSRSFWLPIAAADIDDSDVDPPGKVSPFGTGEPGATDLCTAFAEDWEEDKLD
ncbi:Ig-like domain-containing protein [Thioalkalivibrio sp. ALMg3]|uniref:Ig-like domain-containing protein n=1 Tax=Thioalkalivibrio sp. ALMg3 TaxID=1158163 RepID=UPI0003611F86|nr:Ig-like domain-containing protein [Thioalkalivibrio sp. ALMg3]